MIAFPKGRSIVLRRCSIVLACLAPIVLAGCGKDEAPSGNRSVEAPKAPVEEKIPPYAYAAPVKGHVRERNIGEFDLVDGIAYASAGGGGTVVYAASKPIASPMLVDSACPLTQARALSKLRNASYAEVTLDAAGRSAYFTAGAPFGGGLTDLSPGAWSSTLKNDGEHAAGRVTHRRYGRFEFDLPLSHPTVDELSYRDRDRKRRLAPGTPKPAEPAVTAAYVALRDAALKKDLKATLTAMGFDARQVRAIRGLEGIDADFAVFADRFLTPGAPGDPWSRPGAGQIRSEGTKANGRKYYNDYYFDLCGDRLVLTGIVEQSP